MGPGARLRQERQRRQLSQAALAEAMEVSVQSISRWERDEVIPQAQCRLQLSLFFGLSPEELFGKHEQQELARSPVWNLPYQRNPFFTGRDALLQTLHDHLAHEHTMALTQSWAISGLGGIGKTQIALEYAYRYCQDYEYIFWSSAATRETLLAGFAAIADLVHLPEKTEQDQQKVLQAVTVWLRTQRHWLLILDNADDLTLVQDVLPLEPSGHLLLTTRAQALGALGQRIDVGTMGMAEASLFLLRRAGLLAPEALLDHASEELLAVAETLVIEMDFLPLALDQAGAYIEEVGCSLSAYLKLYRSHRKELLHRRGSAAGQHPEPVSTTWSLSFQKIEQANAAAASLLRLYAFLEPDTIPTELLNDWSIATDPALQSLAINIFQLNEALEELRKFSLVQRDAEAGLLRIHRLVQAVMRDRMEPQEQQYWAECAVRATYHVFPHTSELTTWSLGQRYLPQAQACSSLIEGYSLHFAEAAALLLQAATYLQDHALYEQAERLYQQAFSIQKQVLGSEHPDTSSTLHGLAVLSLRQGHYEQAEPLFRDLCWCREQILGPTHPDLASSLDWFAILFAEQGNYEQAEPLFRRACQIREQALGPQHPDVAISLNGLATLLAEQGKYEQAEPLLQRACQISEQALGADHPDLAQSLNNLADLYKDVERYEQAEPLYQRALHIWKQTLGAEHLYLSYPLDGLADLYGKQGRYEAAEAFCQQSLHIQQQAQRHDHPHVTYCLYRLANLYCKQGKNAEAELLYHQVLSRLEEHPDQNSNSADVFSDFAQLRQAQGNLREASSLYQRALAIYEQVLGPKHPKTTATRDQLHALSPVPIVLEKDVAFDNN